MLNNLPEKWDLEADVVSIGSGIGGLSAAITAHDLGASALVLHALSPDPGPALLSSVGGALTGFLVFIPFYLLHGMAAGDVKMMATVGAFTGPAVALEIAVLAWCAGGLMALAILIYSGRLWLALRNLWGIVWPALLRIPALPPAARESAGSMPYGLAIAAGTVYLLIGRYA